jgi:hypothetical protein
VPEWFKGPVVSVSGWWFWRALCQLFFERASLSGVRCFRLSRLVRLRCERKKNPADNKALCTSLSLQNTAKRDLCKEKSRVQARKRSVMTMSNE